MHAQDTVLPHDWQPVYCDLPCQEHVVGWFCAVCLDYHRRDLADIPFSFCWGPGHSVRPLSLEVN